MAVTMQIERMKFQKEIDKMKVLTTKKGTELPLINLKGKDYLQVAHRLVWFREEHPDWSIETHMQSSGQDYAIFRAEVKNANGFLMASAHKREDMKHFADYIEKAETGSIGRALALCGYGTQFEPELDEGERLADAPIVRPNIHAPSNMQPTDEEAGAGFSHDGIYRLPYGAHKGRTVPQIAELIGKEKLEEVIMKHEEKIKEKKPYAGSTIDQMLTFVNKATDYIVQYENQGVL